MEATTTTRSARNPFDPKLRVAAESKHLYDVRQISIGQRSDRGYAFGKMKTRRNFQIDLPADNVDVELPDTRKSPTKVISMTSLSRKFGPLDWQATGSLKRSQRLGLHPTRCMTPTVEQPKPPFEEVENKPKSRLASFGKSKRFTYDRPCSPGPKYDPLSLSCRRPSNIILGPKSVVRSPKKYWA